MVMAETALRRMRKAKGLSIRDMSRETGINRGRLSIIERGVEPTPDELSRILSVLGVTTDAVQPPEVTA